MSLPQWARIGIIVLAAMVIAVVAILAVRVLTRTPVIPTGSTAADDLQVGSCLAEAERSLDRYTVVGCGEPHPVQIFAIADVGVADAVYDQTQGVLDAFADAVCERYLEYLLFLPDDLERSDHVVSSITTPDAQQYAAGDTDALCVIALESGEPLTGDLYRAMP